MNRKLMALNVVLAAGAIYAGFAWHSRWQAAKQREAGAPLHRSLKPAPPPYLAPLRAESAVLPSGYKTVAMQDLFDPSRNPDVVVEPPPPPPPPPEPPPLPVFHGMMDLGSGPFAIMSVAGSNTQKEVHAGGMIGDFKLVAFDRKEITLEWQGRTIHKRAEDIAANGNNGDTGRGSAPVAPESNPNLGIIPGVASPEPPPPAPARDLGPGQDIVQGVRRACQAGDSSAAGAVVDGYRKVVQVGPFGGGTCYWLAVGK